MARTQDEIRSTILSAAKEYLARYGAAKTTVDDIAKAVNMAKSSLYYYFSSKEDIFKAVFEDEFEKFKTTIETAIALVETPTEKIRSYAIARFQAVKQLSSFHEIMKDGNFRADTAIRQMHSVFNTFEIDLMTSLLNQGIVQGLFSCGNTALSAKAVTLALKFFQAEWVHTSTDEEMTANIDHLMDLLLNGVLKRE